jgi:predicted RNase H-like nuclease (RuvC/YqgF family)|tara:strand:+ start:601 stop:732 length:132 start_codon:yes stop_codon:yes gene_type:complete
MNSDLQRINWKVTQLERNNKVLRSKIVKLERENKKLAEQLNSK